MILHYINNKLIGIANENLFSVNLFDYQLLQQDIIQEIDNSRWVDNHILIIDNKKRYEFTHREEKIYLGDELISNDFRDLFISLINPEMCRLKNRFKTFTD